jgi:hypothetical protein
LWPRQWAAFGAPAGDADVVRYAHSPICWPKPLAKKAFQEVSIDLNGVHAVAPAA